MLIIDIVENVERLESEVKRLEKLSKEQTREIVKAIFILDRIEEDSEHYEEAQKWLNS